MRSALTALIIGAIVGPLGAQTADTSQHHDSVKVALIHQLLTKTHAVDQAMAAMETALPAQKAANPRVPAVFWDRFVAQAHAHRQELEDAISAVYERHFASDELRQLIAFYETPIGQKVLATTPAIMQESFLAGQTWGQRIGASVGAQLESEGIRITPP